MRLVFEIWMLLTSSKSSKRGDGSTLGGKVGVGGVLREIDGTLDYVEIQVEDEE